MRLTVIRVVAATMMLGAALVSQVKAELSTNVVVENPLPVARQAETIEIPWTGNVATVCEAGTPIPSQVFEGKLLFQSDFLAGQTKTFTLSDTPGPVFPVRAYGRYVPERMDDYAWENDRIAFRIYGPVLMQKPPKGQGLVSSGIDVWLKRTRNLVLDKWYKSMNYHTDRGEGLDNYHVGNSRGCGGIAVMANGKFSTSQNWATQKTLAVGPIRTVVELTYVPWECGDGVSVAEIRRIILDAGANLNRFESRFDVTGTNAVTVAVGLGVSKGVQHSGTLVGSGAQGFFANWENVQKDHGSTATAILIPGAAGETKDKDHVYLTAPARSAEPFVWYAGAGWSLSGDFADAAAWTSYVEQVRVRLKAPLKITYSPVGSKTENTAAVAPAPSTAVSTPLPPAPAPLSAEIATAAVLTAMERVADWQLANPSKYPRTLWTQGAGYTGFMALAGISKDSKYRDAMLEMGRKNQWKLGSSPYNADDHCVGQTYAELYLLQHDPAMIAPLRERFDYILANQPETTNLSINVKGAHQRWSWCDALFMAPPAWVRLYAATGEAKYLDYAVQEWWRTTDYLYDKEDHLFFRDSTFFKRPNSKGKKVFWGRGNGWVIGGLVRVLQYLPKNHPDRPRFEQLFKEMTAKILTCQQPDGLWRAHLIAPERFPLKETSGSVFFTYAFAWGVNEGLLDRAQFEPATRKAWAGLVGCVDPYGKLTHVQPTGGFPVKFPEDYTEIYGVGGFLLAGSEVYRMAAFKQK